ncbi:hypothetical protein VB620_15300 [Nodularia harveyana UHCC-0300]|uniref:Uncharacterized protein n=1 Tax=Nodularia harveyana UHCC-0300 TaxID=2974287 RepID=A0ABU5UGQ7_9CYAN|nr:hypothetical protein [Nodularia harveyana]MEA5582704.1 hypothetical protein [Nodularia harveyana UHCC-0300]
MWRVPAKCQGILASLGRGGMSKERLPSHQNRAHVERVRQVTLHDRSQRGTQVRRDQIPKYAYFPRPSNRLVPELALDHAQLEHIYDCGHRGDLFVALAHHSRSSVQVGQ